MGKHGKMKRILSVIMCFSLVFAVYVPTASAAFDPTESKNSEVSVIEKVFYNAIDKVIDLAVGCINLFIRNPSSWTKASEYENDTFMEGTSTFLDSAADGAYWSVGYSNASILTGDELDGNHYVGGSIKLSKKVATEVYDDLKVRTIALSDNSGRGTVVFAVVDSYGLASTAVADIRSMLSSYCEENDIVSLNISVLHQHSAVDTFGLNGNILSAVLNPFRSTPVNGINEEYQENLYNVVCQSVKDAVSSMTSGTMYYGTADFSEHVTDKRDPQVLQTEFDRFRFVPDDGSSETWFTTSCIHCVGNGAGNTQITGDYPYYMEEYINENYGANFIMMLGAEQGTSQDGSTVKTDDMTKVEYLEAYGTALAERFASITDEEVVEPILNIKFEEVQYKITNQILIFAGKMGLLTNTVVKDNFSYYVATEIGYMEIGTDIAVAIVPGEAAAELFYGGCLSADKSWTGTDWELDPIQDAVGDKTLIVFGLTNDQIGYIIPDNDYMALLESQNKSLELVSTGNNTASSMVNDFFELIESVQ